MKTQGHRNLIVWQKSMDLVVMVYRFTKVFPPDEVYGLTSQMKRAAISIPSNIAEGRKRGTEKEFRHFLLIAFGSGAELETQLEIASRLEFGDQALQKELAMVLEEVLRMLSAMTSS